MKKIKVMVLDTEKGFKEMEIENDLDKFYELIDCDLFTIAERKIGNEYYDIFCDDEGLLLKKKISAIGMNGEPMLVGNLVIAKCDENGETIGLNEEDFLNIREHSLTVVYGEQRMYILNRIDY